jgi:signal transduction histidine kinase
MPDHGADGHAAAEPSHEHEYDGRLVRRVRLQLVAWSAGSTLVVLVVLGAALYAAVATSLASSSEAILRDRAALLATSSTVPAIGVVGLGIGAATITTSTDPALPGLVVGGPYAGTLAVLVASSAVSVPLGSGPPIVPSPGATGAASIVPGQTDALVGTGLPDPVGYAAAVAGETVVRETTYLGSPVRVLSMPRSASAASPGGVTQVVADRTAELRTLGVLLAVLIGGGLVALAVAAILGAMYATRALVPIRASLRRQREFAADTSHELRTPLAVIRAGVARVRQQPDARVSEIAPTLDAVDAETVRLGGLVDDLLALARTDAGPSDLDLRPCDLADIAADALAALEPLASGRSVRLALDVEPAPMTGDPDRLRRLVTVLADNAIRHGREGGNVIVTVRSGSLFVEDDGPGIPPQDRNRVFERFWRGASAAPGGSGLGLAIAAWIVERHGGRISAGASPAGGARISVTLPRQ